MDFDLQRFKQGQEHGGMYQSALAELRAGHKTSHWIWYVFPQLQGLGSSAMARHYGLAGRAEAEAYLADEVLRGRLAAAVALAHVALCLRGARLESLMGSEIDALKLVSSMTLFAAVARKLAARGDAPDIARLAREAQDILEAAARQGYPRCSYTAARIG